METKLFGTDPKFFDLDNPKNIATATDTLSDPDNYYLDGESIEKDCWSYKNDCHYTKVVGHATWICGIKNYILPGIFLMPHEESEVYLNKELPITRENLQMEIEYFLDLPNYVDYLEEEDGIELDIQPIVTAWEQVNNRIMVRVWWIQKTS